jgi:hypothetical protein
MFEYSQYEDDREFRKYVVKLFDSAEYEVNIVTGEGAAYGWEDIKEAQKRAMNRGVVYKIYGDNLRYKDDWLSYGCVLYEGEEESDAHYCVVDGKTIMISDPHPRGELGNRKGKGYYRDDPEGVWLIEQGLTKFEGLISEGHLLPVEDPIEKKLDVYIKLSDKYSKDAEELLKRRDYIQASEKLWGAVAEIVKAVAAKRGRESRRHDFIRTFTDELSEELSEPEIKKDFAIVEQLHRNFYENDIRSPREVIWRAEIARKLVAELKGLL